MCAICGCGHDHEHHDHDHDHDHDHAHTHDHAHDGRVIRLERDLLAKNDRLAERNRGWLAGRGVVAFNLVSSPGAGKTTLLERTIRMLGQTPVFVVEGDQATDRDAARVRAAGARAVQINTGTGCHLDAAMVARALPELDPPAGALLFIENVGNLVCPALFDLGEARRVLVVSVTEGDDKPYKYPHMFRSSDLVVLGKEDLLPYVPFDVDAFAAAVQEVRPRTPILRLSAATGSGMDPWVAWLRAQEVA